MVLNGGELTMQHYFVVVVRLSAKPISGKTIPCERWKGGDTNAQQY